ncbi:MAG: DUF1010 domain-containing protein [Comamonas sp.]|nr:DUF1010 domain-containing protein [Comamonas sp.]
MAQRFFAVCARRQVGVPVLAFGSNCAVKPTRLRRAAYFRSLVVADTLQHAQTRRASCVTSLS